jgi:uncharacterized protein involved in tolerance to divalent cations
MKLSTSFGRLRLCTCCSEDDAVRLGHLITEARLGACVQIVGPIRSVYWWEGKVQDEREWQLLIKTTAARLPALEELAQSQLIAAARRSKASHGVTKAATLAARW